MKSKMIWIRIALVLIIFLNLGFIFANSAMDGKTSSNVSNNIASGTIDIIDKDYQSKPPSEQKEILNKHRADLRRLAHCAEFLPLGFFVTLLTATFFGKAQSLKGMLLRLVSCFSVSFAFGAICAALDELHQLSVYKRTYEVADMQLDSIGVAVGAGIACIIVLFALRKGKITDDNR